MLVSSYASGWQLLSRRFKTQTRPAPEAPSFRRRWFKGLTSAVRLRYWSQYEGVIRLVATEQGLFLSVVFLYRPSHPSLYIPWGEITASKVEHFLRTYIELRLGSLEQIPMRLSEDVGNQLDLYQRFSQLGTYDLPPDAAFTTLTDEAAARIERKVIPHGDDSAG